MGLAPGGPLAGRNPGGALRPGLVAAPPVAPHARGRPGLAARVLPERDRGRDTRPLLAARDARGAIVHRAYGAAPASPHDGAPAPTLGGPVPAHPLGPSSPSSAKIRDAGDATRAGPARPSNAHLDTGGRYALHRHIVGLALPGLL